jgi:hypothetical protein
MNKQVIRKAGHLKLACTTFMVHASVFGPRNNVLRYPQIMRFAATPAFALLIFLSGLENTASTLAEHL